MEIKSLTLLYLSRNMISQSYIGIRKPSWVFSLKKTKTKAHETHLSIISIYTVTTLQILTVNWLNCHSYSYPELVGLGIERSNPGIDEGREVVVVQIEPVKRRVEPERCLRLSGSLRLGHYAGCSILGSIPRNTRLQGPKELCQWVDHPYDYKSTRNPKHQQKIQEMILPVEPACHVRTSFRHLWVSLTQSVPYQPDGNISHELTNGVRAFSRCFQGNRYLSP